MTDVTGVAIPQTGVKSGIFNRRCLKIGGIATPVCGLVRNDIVLFGLFLFCNSPRSSDACHSSQNIHFHLLNALLHGKTLVNVHVGEAAVVGADNAVGLALEH